ncbi:hypothetical protein L210DRAFT_3639296 [Boletus edulis BED1]|uniref:Uncharacterized protein n=1 Tax=Boletus edulis BED1 TaxID=1328754 RepID=A0AAD4C9Q9_BOLED|nr:hypothetical protein L210DRAFT_3639296 [Boletus edulis BED1]
MSNDDELAIPTLSPSRSRVRSAPHSLLPLGPGIPAHSTPDVLPPLGAGIPARWPPKTSLHSPPTSPFRTSFVSHTAHSRTRSISSGPSVPSPRGSSFPVHVPLHPFPSFGPPEIHVSDADVRVPPSHTRRHSRLHSRNLSIFFPRSPATISEDERPVDEEAPPPSPDPILIPASQSDGIIGPSPQASQELNPGFTFGGLPKSNSEPNGIRTSGSGVTARRGHHHKHSMSHNFFSFLEPGRPQKLDTLTGERNLQSSPTPTPISAFAQHATTRNLIPTPEPTPRSESKSPASVSNSVSSSQSSNIALERKNVSPVGTAATITAFAQFALGALLWTRGQSIGSLACTGLGYWVVFDALGVAGPVIVARRMGGKMNGMYGLARRATTLLFAQCVYLMFAGIYVAKEAVEHLLLSAGGNAHGHGHSGGAGDGHHHHWGDERPETLGLRFPVSLVCLVLASLVGTSAVFGQHEVLVNITNKHIPSPLSLLRPAYLASPPAERRTGAQRILRNPYALPPILFCLAILGAEVVLDVAHYAPFDLALAALEVIVTAHVAFAACVVLGGVLLQTSPPMMVPPALSNGGFAGGLHVPFGTNGPAGRMETFWRVVREIERHEHVVHLPAPHVWQVVPFGQPRSMDGHTSVDAHAQLNGHAHSHDHESHTHAYPSDLTKHGQNGQPPALIITLSPHVRPTLPDVDVLALTKWAQSRVLAAFARNHCGKDGECSEVEVTVGVVRG